MPNEIDPNDPSTWVLPNNTGKPILVTLEDGTVIGIINPDGTLIIRDEDAICKLIRSESIDKITHRGIMYDTEPDVGYNTPGISLDNIPQALIDLCKGNEITTSTAPSHLPTLFIDTLSITRGDTEYTPMDLSKLDDFRVGRGVPDGWTEVSPNVHIAPNDLSDKIYEHLDTLSVEPSMHGTYSVVPKDFFIVDGIPMSAATMISNAQQMCDINIPEIWESTIGREIQGIWIDPYEGMLEGLNTLTIDDLAVDMMYKYLRTRKVFNGPLFKIYSLLYPDDVNDLIEEIWKANTQPSHLNFNLSPATAMWVSHAFGMTELVKKDRDK